MQINPLQFSGVSLVQITPFGWQVHVYDEQHPNIPPDVLVINTEDSNSLPSSGGGTRLTLKSPIIEDELTPMAKHPSQYTVDDITEAIERVINSDATEVIKGERYSYHTSLSGMHDSQQNKTSLKKARQLFNSLKETYLEGLNEIADNTDARVLPVYVQSKIVPWLGVFSPKKKEEVGQKIHVAYPETLEMLYDE